MEGTQLTRLVATIKESLQDQPFFLKAVKLIGQNIQKTGMPVPESALLARLSESDLADLLARCPQVSTYFEIKRLQYKRDLLRVVNDQATINKDIKMAQYLLEKNFSDEFDSSIKREKEKTKAPKVEDPMEKLMEHLRSEAPASPVDESVHQKPEKTEEENAVLELSHLVHA
jgi:hypothetical protein